MKFLTIIALILLIIIILLSHSEDIEDFLVKDNTNESSFNLNQEQIITEEEKVELLKRLKELGYVE
ncbi:hypothetical protein HQ533_04845 [Candidatus Woesearchaeota archaeon]|nr:hypothetical protein [Candidatus Woesearchaeota archaeon]